jgi:hypothetical protein
MKLEWDFSELENFVKRINNADKYAEMCKKLTQELAKVLHKMVMNETPVKTGELLKGWRSGENYSYKIIALRNGYKVTLYNRVPYAKSVNDGHYSYNQYGGAYEVNPKHRTVPYTQGNNDSTFVFGHFFVEKSILKVENSAELEKVLSKELEKWFAWCVNGK